MTVLSHDMPAWWPWLAVALVALAVIAGLSFVRVAHPFLSRRLRVLLWSLRCAAAAVVLLCLLDWRREHERTTQEHPLVQVLVDRSASMAVADASGGATRHAAALGALDKAVRPLWPEASRLPLGTAGTGFLREDPVKTRADAPVSALALSLRQAIDAQGGQALAGVVLLTDGAASDAADLAAVGALYANARVPVYPWVFGTSAQAADSRIVSARLLQPGLAQPTMRLDLELDSPGQAGRKAALVVRYEGQVLWEGGVTLSGAPQVFSTEFLSPYRGLNFYDIELAPAEGEVQVANNRVRAACELRRDPLRVLYMEGSEPEETGILKDALESDPDIEVTCLHFPSSALRKQGDIARVMENFRGRDMRVFADAKGRSVPSVCHPSRGFPATLDKLLAYDVVVVSDIVKEAFSESQHADMVTFVEQFGGGFMMIGGDTSFGAGGWEKTKVEKLMPIEVGTRNDTIWANLEVRLPEAAWAHPIMQVGDTQGETRDAWTTRFPGFGGVNFVKRAKPAAIVLAEVTQPAGGWTPSRPLLLFAVQQIGKGRTMAFTSDTTKDWGTKFETTWGRSGDETDNCYFCRFWNNTVRWLAAGRVARKAGSLAIALDRSQSPVGAVARVSMPARSPAEPAALEFVVRDPKGVERPLGATWQAGAQAWNAEFVPDMTGDWLVRARYRTVDGRPGLVSAGLWVHAADAETFATAANTAAMDALAAATGGRRLTDANAAEILAPLASREVPVIWKREEPAWDTPWLLILLVGLLSAEWLVRRRLEPVLKQ